MGFFIFLFKLFDEGFLNTISLIEGEQELAF